LRTGAFDRDYWLCRCEGFEVRTPEGRLRAIREVRYRSRLDRPDELVLRGGFFPRREEVVSISEVEEVAPDEQRILLRARGEPARHRFPRPRLRFHGA
jgi:hypothetical protein